jgi:hypothetical protein
MHNSPQLLPRATIRSKLRLCEIEMPFGFYLNGLGDYICSRETVKAEYEVRRRPSHRSRKNHLTPQRSGFIFHVGVVDHFLFPVASG